MKAIVYEDRNALLDWASLHTPGGTFRDDAQAIGLARDGELCAVVVFDTFGPTMCHMSVAAEPGRRWLTREFVRHVAAYPFITCKFPRITCVISEDNADSLRFAEHLGCSLEGRMREAGLFGEDWLLYGLLRRECQWLPKTLLT